VREILHRLAADPRVRPENRVHVSHQPWEELCALCQKLDPDLLVLSWPCHLSALHVLPEQALGSPPCDLVLVGGNAPDSVEQILVPIRGGPYAELALRLSLAIAEANRARVTSLHLIPRKELAVDQSDAPFRGLERVIHQLEEVQPAVMETANPLESILAAAHSYDLVVMGATAQPEFDFARGLGPVAEGVIRESPAGVMIVKTKRQAPESFASEEVGQTAISVLVDKWFAENTYHAEEFSDQADLIELKRRQGLTVSLALPALNEAETVGNVLRTIKEALVECAPLLDEIVLVDSDSTDATRTIAAGMGVPVFIHQQVLPGYGARSGKGEALWKSLYLTSGDILLWIDTDIVNIHPRFVYGILGPLLARQDIDFVKGFYRRPLRVGDKVQAGGGGRVTELTARPMLNLFYPELSGIVQPLSGEYGGRRSVLERLPFFSGYGVEIGLLIDVLECCGLGAIAQVDLLERVHHNQPLESLSKMSFAIIQAVIRKLERRSGGSILEEVNRTMKLIRYEPSRFFLDIEEIAERERPPMIEIPEYQERRLV
jgi:glucosyl-3-phosphoglycerate synthase